MLSRSEEILLITQCVLRDDRRAFARLVEAYQSPLRSFLLSLTGGDRDLSDDLAQETFIQMYTHLRQFRGMARLKTWLYRIAYNEFYTHLRQRGEQRLPDGGDAPPERGDDAAGERSADATLDLQTAFATLTPAERTVATLYFVHDLAIKDVASVTGMPTGTVKSHISRARTKLAAVLR